MRTPMRWTAVSLAGVLFLAGCSGGGADSASDSGGAADIANDSAAEAPAGAVAEDGGDATGSGAPGLSLATSDREVITSGSVTMTVEDPEAVAADLGRVVENLGGWVEELTQQAATENTDASARMVVRIPSQDVTSTLERLADYGSVDDINLPRTDVTMQVRDLEARIRALNLSIQRMEDLLARATTTTDLVNAEQMLTDRQSELESLLSQQALLADQVSMSTLDIQMWTLESAPEPEPEPPSGFWGGLVTGWNAFLEFGSGADSSVHIWMSRVDIDTWSANRACWESRDSSSDWRSVSICSALTRSVVVVARASRSSIRSMERLRARIRASRSRTCMVTSVRARLMSSTVP